MEVNQDNQDFDSFSKSPYFVDNTDSIAYAFAFQERHAVITRPRRWGKTLFLQSFQLFCGLDLDEEGNIIEQKNTDKSPFGVFTHLKVVTEDTIRINDILFILQSQQMENSTSDQFEYFTQAGYPEFNRSVKKEEEQKKLLDKKHKSALTCFLPNEHSSFCEENSDQQKKTLEEQIKLVKQDNKKTKIYYQLLKEFGQTCRHYQRYPIIFITFPTGIRKIKNSTQAETQFTLDMNESIKKLYKDNLYIFEQMKKKQYFEGDIKVSEGFLYGSNEKSQLNYSLSNLTSILKRLYKVKSIVLIDEYDSVIISAEISGCIEEIANHIIQPMLTAALKNNNDQVCRSFIAGITRVAKADIFSGINHLQECTLLDKNYTKFFGFSEEQVKLLLQKCNLQMPANQQIDYDKLKLMYNQYRIGEGSFFNPFSIYKCFSVSVKDQCPTYDPFWTDSASINYLADIFTRTQDFENSIDNFLKNELVFTPNTHLDFSCLRKKSGISLADSYSFAFHLGYLTLSENQNLNTSTMTENSKKEKIFKIPNEEIREQMLKNLMPIFYQTKWNITQINFDTLLNFHNNLDKMERFEERVKSTFLDGLDSKQSRTESDFQAIFYQLNNLVGTKYESKNEQQTVKGNRLDTIFYPKNQSSTIIVLHEYKLSKDGNSQKSLDDALWQIFSKGYVENALPKNTNLTNTTHVLIRALVFFNNLETSKWQMKAEQCMLNITEAEQLIEACAAYENLVKKHPEESEKNIRKMFLTNPKFSSISKLMSSHSLSTSSKTDFSSSAPMKEIRPLHMRKFAVPQEQFYQMDYFHSLKATNYPSPQKMATQLSSDFQRAENRRLQVKSIQQIALLRRTLSFLKKIL